MTRHSLVLFLIFSNPCLPAHAAEARSESIPVKAIEREAGPEALTIEQFIQWLLDTGRDRIDFDNRSAKPLKLPRGGVRNKARGAPSKQNADKAYRASHLVIKKSRFRKKIKPKCLILLKTKEYYKTRKAKEWFFRFNLDGSLERAFSALGEVDEQGKRVRASSVNTVQDVADPDVQEKAQAELDFWFKRAARLIAKKKAASKKQTSSPVAASAAADSPPSRPTPAAKPVSYKP